MKNLIMLMLSTLVTVAFVVCFVLFGELGFVNSLIIGIFISFLVNVAISPNFTSNMARCTSGLLALFSIIVFLIPGIVPHIVISKTGIIFCSSMIYFVMIIAIAVIILETQNMKNKN